jgi:hypothetical protein
MPNHNVAKMPSKRELRMLSVFTAVHERTPLSDSEQRLPTLPTRSRTIQLLSCVLTVVRVWPDACLYVV